MDLFSNPMVLILLAVVALAMFGGGSFSITELLLTLLRALKLIPESTPKSNQIYQGYVKRAWQVLKDGKLDEAQTLLSNGVQATEAALSEEQAVAPKGIMDTIQEWLKSPMFLIILAVGAFLIFGGMDGCKKPAPEPAPQVEQTLDVTPAVWRGDAIAIRPAAESHYEQVMQAYQLQQATRGLTPDGSPGGLEPADIPPALPLDYDDPDAVRLAGCTTGACAGPVVQRIVTYRSKVGFWQRGPVRRGIAAVVRARPLRRVAGAIVRCCRRRR